MVEFAGCVERNINFETTKLKVHRGNSWENVGFPPTNSNSVRGVSYDMRIFSIFCFVSMCESVQRGDNAALHGTCALCDIPTRFEPCQRYSKKRSIFLAPGADRILVPVGGLSAPSRGPGRIRTSSKNPSASSKMSKRRPRQHCHGGDY